MASQRSATAENSRSFAVGERRRLSFVFGCAMLCLAPGLCATQAHARTYPKLFGFVEVFGTSWAKPTGSVINWVAMRKQWRDGAPCETNICTTRGWKEMVAQVTAAGGLGAKIKLANDLINDKSKHPYIPDAANWGKADYWATAFQFLKKSGDCEDFAIAKYMLLKAAGVPKEDLRVVAVTLKNDNNIAHAILVVYQGDRLLVLDNRFAHIMDDTVARLEYRPVLSMNEQFWSYPRPN